MQKEGRFAASVIATNPINNKKSIREIYSHECGD